MRRKDSAIGFRSNMLIVLLLIAVLIGCSDEEPIVISPEVPETENPDKEAEDPDTGTEDPEDIPSVEDINYETKTFTLLTLEKPSYLASEDNVQWNVISSPSEIFRISHLDAQTALFVAAIEGEYTLKVTEALRYLLPLSSTTRVSSKEALFFAGSI